MTLVIRRPKLMMEAQVRADSFDEADNTIDVIWTTGATVRRVSWMDGEFDEELVVSGNSVRLDRLNSGAPFLDTHASYSLESIIGSVVRGSAKIEGGKGVAKIRLSSAPDAVDRVAKIKEGSASNISVGYRIHSVERKERDGKIPLHRVTDWEPWEISSVPIPADPGAQVRAEQSAETFECRVTPSMADMNATLKIRMQMLSLHHGLAG